MLQVPDRRGIVGMLKEDDWPIVLFGLLMFGSASCFILSLKYIAVAIRIIMAGRPVLTATFSWLFFKEAADKARWPVIALVGMNSFKRFRQILTTKFKHLTKSGQLFKFASVISCPHSYGEPDGHVQQ